MPIGPPTLKTWLRLWWYHELADESFSGNVTSDINKALCERAQNSQPLSVTVNILRTAKNASENTIILYYSPGPSTQ